MLVLLGTAPSRVRCGPRNVLILLVILVACTQEQPWGPPEPIAPDWAEHVAGDWLATGHYYLRFDAPAPHSAEDIESFYAAWLEPRGWTRTPDTSGPTAAQDWTPFAMEDGSGGLQRFVRWVDPSRKWSCRVGLNHWNHGNLTADVVMQPSRELPIDAP